MIVQTGTAISFDAVLSNLVTFLTTNGWTLNLQTAVGEATGQKAHLQKAGTHGTIYVNLKSFIADTATNIWNGTLGVLNTANWNQIDGLAMNLSKGYNAGETRWSYQTNGVSSGNLTSVPRVAQYIGGKGSVPTYWFFQQSSPEMVVVYVEHTLGFYTMFSFGELDKTGAGAYTGGQFFYGCTCQHVPLSYYGGTTPYYGWPDPFGFYRMVTHPFQHYTLFYSVNNVSNNQHNMFVQLDPALHGGANGWLGPMGTGVTNTTYAGSGAWSTVVSTFGNLSSSQYHGYPNSNLAAPDNILRRSANGSNLVTEFIPIQFFWQRGLNTANTSTPQMTLLGTLPNIYMVNMRDITPKQTATFGSDDFIFLPVNQKYLPFTNDLVTISSRNLRSHGTGFAIKTN